MNNSQTAMLTCFLSGMGPKESVEFLVKEGHKYEDLLKAAEDLLKRLEKGEPLV